MMSLLRVGHGEEVGFTQWVETAWPCLGLALKSPWSEPSGAFLLF